MISERADRAGDYDVNAASGVRVIVQDSKGAALADGVFGKQAADGAWLLGGAFISPFAQRLVLTALHRSVPWRLCSGSPCMVY